MEPLPSPGLVQDVAASAKGFFGFRACLEDSGLGLLGPRVLGFRAYGFRSIRVHSAFWGVGLAFQDNCGQRFPCIP